MKWLDSFAVWPDRYRARLAVRRAEVHKLWQQRDALFAERASAPPDEQLRIDARLAEVARNFVEACCLPSTSPILYLFGNHGTPTPFFASR
jgi:hypothetical protein